MDSRAKNAGPSTPVKTPQTSRSKTPEIPKDSENSNPNVTSPGQKPSKSPAIKSSAKTQKSPSRNPNKIRERKFVVAKRNSKREKTSSEIAYERLRASQEDFFKYREGGGVNGVEEQDGEKKHTVGEIANGHGREPEGIEGFRMNPNEIKQSGEMGSAKIEKKSVPKPGSSGRVMNLVKAFERLVTEPNSKDSDMKDERESGDKGMEWALKGLQPEVPETETQVFSPSFCSLDLCVTSESLGLDSRVSSSSDSSHGSFTVSSRASGGGHRSRRNSSESSGTFGGSGRKKKQLKASCQVPFKLRTEQRGRSKEEEFIKKVQQMMTEEERQRIPIAQGLPWTTDEPECLVKPPVKERTRPVDLMLHSDVRAVERTEFDQQVAGKMCLIEQYKMERERQRKLAEEEEIRRLRKELVPRAQPLPYFDRPFVPRRSLKHPTLPRQPKFHIPEHKKIKCGISS